MMKERTATSYLVWRKLELISLIRNDLASFHWEDTVTLGRYQRQCPMLKIYSVLALKVCVDGDGLFFASLTILQRESVILRIRTQLPMCWIKSESLDGVDTFRSLCDVISK
jgi:hypothetical protein